MLETVLRDASEQIPTSVTYNFAYNLFMDCWPQIVKKHITYRQFDFTTTTYLMEVLFIAQKYTLRNKH